MSKDNMGNKNNYISELTEEQKITFLRVLVAISRCDDNFDDEEKSFIKNTAIIFGISKDKADAILAPISDEELIKEASTITSRQAALHLIKEACLLANSDGDINDREIILIGKIGQAMNVEFEKIEQISKWIIDRIIWLERGKIIFEQV